MGTVREESRSVQTSGLDDVINWGRINSGSQVGSGRVSGKISSSALANWTLKYLWDF